MLKQQRLFLVAAFEDLSDRDPDVATILAAVPGSQCLLIAARWDAVRTESVTVLLVSLAPPSRLKFWP